MLCRDFFLYFFFFFLLNLFLFVCLFVWPLQVFQKELGKRTVSVQALKRSARELIESSHDDSSWVKVQMQELSTRWESVCNLSVSKQARLEQALCQVLRRSRGRHRAGKESARSLTDLCLLESG